MFSGWSDRIYRICFRVNPTGFSGFVNCRIFRNFYLVNLTGFFGSTWPDFLGTTYRIFRTFFWLIWPDFRIFSGWSDQIFFRLIWPDFPDFLSGKSDRIIWINLTGFSRFCWVHPTFLWLIWPVFRIFFPCKSDRISGFFSRSTSSDFSRNFAENIRWVLIRPVLFLNSTGCQSYKTFLRRTNNQTKPELEQSQLARAS